MVQCLSYYLFDRSQDGIQVDKIRHIVYNFRIAFECDITLPTPSGTLMLLFRDNFSPSFVVLGTFLALCVGMG